MEDPYGFSDDCNPERLEEIHGEITPEEAEEIARMGKPLIVIVVVLIVVAAVAGIGFAASKYLFTI